MTFVSRNQKMMPQYYTKYILLSVRVLPLHQQLGLLVHRNKPNLSPVMMHRNVTTTEQHRVLANTINSRQNFRRTQWFLGSCHCLEAS